MVIVDVIPMFRVMADLNQAEVARAVTLIQIGCTFRQVAEELDVSPSVIHRVVKRYEDTGQYTRRPGQGRKRKTNRNEDRFMVLSALRRRTSTARDLQNDLRTAHNTDISGQTVRNRLRDAGLRSRKPVRALSLNRGHKVARVMFARQHANWELRHWRRVLFTDESRFRLTRCDGRVRVWRRRGERYEPVAVQEVDRFGLGSVMVWGGISVDYKTDLVLVPGNLNAANYIADILEMHVVTAAQIMDPGFILVQDNARVHVANDTMNFLRELEIQAMDWPAMSPDLNPIEHVWDMLERRIRLRPAAPQNLQELQEALIEEWERLPQMGIRKLVRSMPRRCQEVLRVQGNHTRY